jgi:hypothetical protein
MTVLIKCEKLKMSGLPYVRAREARAPSRTRRDGRGGSLEEASRSRVRAIGRVRGRGLAYGRSARGVCLGVCW